MCSSDLAGLNGGANFKGGNPAAMITKAQEWLEQGRSYVLLHLFWIIPLATIIALIALAFWGFILWLSSRGHFMFLHCVALEKAEVRAPWSQYARQAHSLFLFRLVLSIVAAALTIPAAVGFVSFLVPLLSNGGAAATVVAVLAAISIGFVAVIAAFLWFVISKLTRDFVVPIQFVRGCHCREGWSILIGLISRNVGEFLLYLLFQIVLWMAIYAAVAVLILVTCCIAGCLLALPYIGTVVFLPALAFQRAYSAHYLAQYGPNLSPV